MHRIGLAAIVLVAVSGGAAHGHTLTAQDLYRRAEALAHSLIGGPAADRDVIAPPADIDPQMAVAPPPGGRERIINPPAEAPQQ